MGQFPTADPVNTTQRVTTGSWLENCNPDKLSEFESNRRADNFTKFERMRLL